MRVRQLTCNFPGIIREESMKSIWWTVAMLTLAALSVVANKVLA